MLYRPTSIPFPDKLHSAWHSAHGCLPSAPPPWASRSVEEPAHYLSGCSCSPSPLLSRRWRSGALLIEILSPRSTPSTRLSRRLSSKSNGLRRPWNPMVSLAGSTPKASTPPSHYCPRTISLLSKSRCAFLGPGPNWPQIDAILATPRFGTLQRLAFTRQGTKASIITAEACPERAPATFRSMKWWLNTTHNFNRL